MKKNFSTTKRGFTLVELMAAMAITSILILVIVALTSKGVDIWRLVVQDVRATTKARAALNFMVSDLQSIQLRSGNNYEWLVAEIDANVGRPDNIDMGPEGMQFTNASRLIFFTTAMDRNPAIRSGEARTAMEDNLSRKQTAGDINCVGYKLEYRDQILNRSADDIRAGFPVYALYRNLIPSYDTKEDLLGRKDLYEVYKRYVANETHPLNFLVENILEMTLVFEVDYRTRDTSSGEQSSNQLAYRRVENVPIIAAGSVSGTNVYRKVSIFGDRLKVEKLGTSDQQMSHGNVVAVSISVTVISNEGMAIVEEVRNNRRVAPNTADFIKRYTKQFCQRVALPQPN